MKNFRHTIFLLTLITHLTSIAQEQVYGDSGVVKYIKEKTSKIYETKDKTHFLLTKKRLLEDKTFGTNIIAYSMKGKINRIIAISTTKKGILSSEYYFENNQLIYNYETFEYFDKYGGERKWKNFKNLPAWESKYYIDHDNVKYQRQKGLELIRDSKKLNRKINDGYSLFRYVSKST